MYMQLVIYKSNIKMSKKTAYIIYVNIHKKARTKSVILI